MRLIPLLFTAMLAAAPAGAQPSPQQDANQGQAPKEQESSLPVSLDKIREALAQTPNMRLKGLDQVPTFKVEIHEARRPFALEDLVKSLAPGFKAGPVPAGGLYNYELQRQANNPVDNPLTQPYAPFNQPQLLTVLIENLVGKYLGGRALNAVSSAEREHAEAQARDEVHRAVAEYCAAQPYGGRSIEICNTPIQ